VFVLIETMTNKSVRIAIIKPKFLLTSPIDWNI